MSLASKYSSSLCLVVLATDEPDEKAVFSSVKDYLFEKGFSPIEVRSPGEALIQIRQAKFFLVIVPDDDHDLIKKIKSDDGLNADTFVIAISSDDVTKDTTKELLDQNIIQYIIKKTADLENFQKTLIETIKSHLNLNRATLNDEGTTNVSQPQEANNAMVQNSQSDHTYPKSFQSHPTIPQSHLSFTMASQSGPVYQPFFPANQASLHPFLSQSQQSFSNQSYPLQPFTLMPPMVVPYHALLQASGANFNSLSDEDYMMPRIVDFGATQCKMTPQVQQGYMPCFTGATVNPKMQEKGKDFDSTYGKIPIQIEEHPNREPMIEDKGVSDSTSNNVPGAEGTSLNETQDKNEPLKKLPGFEKFLECLKPQTTNFSNEEKDTSRYEGLPPSKRPRTETRSLDSRSFIGPSIADDEAKNPLSLLQTRPYFMNLEEQMEDIAFDPKVRSSDRHNAKERHRRIRITRATDFFKENIPCMNANMDKATALQMTVYYILFLRNALRQMDPNIIDQLYKSYLDEWKSYFEKVSVTVE